MLNQDFNLPLIQNKFNGVLIVAEYISRAILLKSTRPLLSRGNYILLIIRLIY